jgi:hypothetical protein
MQADAVRRLALALPEAVEAPHFQMRSFRVDGKIFATMPPDQQTLNVFVSEEVRAPMVAANPAAFRDLQWGAKVVGMTVLLAQADAASVQRLLRLSWACKAPKRLAATLAAGTT